MASIDEKHKLEREHFEASDNIRWELEKAQEAEAYFRNQVEEKEKEIADLRKKIEEVSRESETYRRWWLSETDVTDNLRKKLKALENDSDTKKDDSEEEKATA